MAHASRYGQIYLENVEKSTLKINDERAFKHEILENLSCHMNKNINLYQYNHIAIGSSQIKNLSVKGKKCCLFFLELVLVVSVFIEICQFHLYFLTYNCS